MELTAFSLSSSLSLSASVYVLIQRTHCCGISCCVREHFSSLLFYSSTFLLFDKHHRLCTQVRIWIICFFYIFLSSLFSLSQRFIMNLKVQILADVADSHLNKIKLIQRQQYVVSIARNT